jgi:hydrogenase maturation protease
MGPRILVIGYGNSLRGDDAFGPLVAQRLAEDASARDVDILVRHQLTPELAENIRDASLVIFIDASADGEVGEVVCRRLTPDPDASLSMAHHFAPGGLVHFVQVAYGRIPDAYVLSTRGSWFDFADAQVSPPVAAAVPLAIARIRELMAQHRALPACESETAAR